MTTSPPPRRKWNITRWLLVFALLALAWSGWRVYAFRSAISKAKALGWTVEYTDPVETIRKNWKSAFKKETWLDGETDVRIPTGEAFEQNLAIVHRLNPTGLVIRNSAKLHDLSALKPLSRLRGVGLSGCTGLTNVDGLNSLSALQSVQLIGGTELTNVDGLRNLPSLRYVFLNGCTGLTNVDGLNSLSALQMVELTDCTGLRNMDGLSELSALQTVSLNDCTGLTNVDGLRNLPALRGVMLKGCTGLTKESVAALKAALPKARVFAPDGKLMTP